MKTKIKSLQKVTGYTVYLYVKITPYPLSRYPVVGGHGLKKFKSTIREDTIQLDPFFTRQ